MARADYAGEVIAACCGPALHLWRPQPGAANAQYVGKVLPSDGAVLAAAWNRNNKVVGAARGDGGIELRYSSGDVMSVLPRGGPAPGAAPLTALSWSMGSKRLAAASADGSVYVHDMTTKACTPLRVGAAPVAAVAFHPDDKFLAAAGRQVTVFSPQLTLVGDLATGDASGRTCLSAAAAQPWVAAGSAGGGVAVWDVKTQRALHEDAGAHPGGATALEFAALDASTLCTAGADGSVLLLDLRAGALRARGAAARMRTAGAGVASLAVREDFTLLAAGTADGEILLFDPRAPAAPLHRLRCAGGGAVTGLHWQHNYQSQSAAARAEAAAGHGAGGALAPPAARRPAGQLGSPAAAAPPRRASLLPDLAPPLSLDMSPMPASSRAPAINSAPSPAPGAARALPTRPAAHSPAGSGADSLGAPPPRAAEPAAAASRPRPPPLAAPAAEPQSSPAARPAAGAPGWSIKAVTPRRPGAGAGAGAGAGGSRGSFSFGGGAGGAGPSAPDVAAAQQQQQQHGGHPSAVDTQKQPPPPPPPRSPAKAPLAAAARGGGGAAAAATAPPASRDDLLALHLDMLEQFREQQASTAALVAGVVARQEALAGEVAALRRQLGELLTRREEVMWL